MENHTDLFYCPHLFSSQCCGIASARRTRIISLPIFSISHHKIRTGSHFEKENSFASRGTISDITRPQSRSISTSETNPRRHPSQMLTTSLFFSSQKLQMRKKITSFTAYAKEVINMIISQSQGRSIRPILPLPRHQARSEAYRERGCIPPCACRQVHQ